MLKGNKINLRVVRRQDLDSLFLLLSDVENRGDFFPIRLTSEPQFRERFEKTGFWQEDEGRLLIVDKSDDTILGIIKYEKTINYFDALELGYILFNQSRRNQGLMTEAVSMLVRFLFETRKVHRLHLTVDVGNLASRRVAEKCGFRSEGIARQAIFHRGKNIDTEWFSLLRDEFATRLKEADSLNREVS